jgi:hypothetical protein
VGDVDGDGAKEFVWGTGLGDSGADNLVVAGFNPGISVEWTNDNPKQLDGPFVGSRLARTAPGVSSLLFAVPRTNSGCDGMRLLALDPVTGLFRSSAEVGSNWSQVGALDVADYDLDGVDEVFLATANLYDGYFVAYDFSAGVAEWTSPANIGNGSAVTHADLNGDGYPDLVAITRDGYVHAYDVKHQTLIWKSTGLGSGVSVAAADLDGDGIPEIVAASSTGVTVFEKAAPPYGYLVRSSVALSNAKDLVVADLDGDSTPEIYVLTGSYGSPSSVTRLDASLQILGSFSLGVSASSLHVEDLPFARKNLVVSVGELGYNASTRPRLQAVDPRTGAEIWRSPVLWGAVPTRSLSYVDLDQNGHPHIAFGTTYGMYLTR